MLPRARTSPIKPIPTWTKETRKPDGKFFRPGAWKAEFFTGPEAKEPENSIAVLSITEFRKIPGTTDDLRGASRNGDWKVFPTVTLGRRSEGFRLACAANSNLADY